MILLSSGLCLNPYGTTFRLKSNTNTIAATTLRNITICTQKQEHLKELKKITKDFDPFCYNSRFCSCCVTRRHLIQASLGSALLPIGSSMASQDLLSDNSMAMLNKFHPPRPGWYEELYAYVLAKFTKSYEAEIADYKSKLFANLRGKASKVLEFGIGTGPNLKYYANEPDIHLIGIDPNKKMEKYASAAAESAGLPSTNFTFVQGVAEALPVDDASVDAVIGTLVLCSVEDINLTLQEIMRVLKPGGLYLFVEHVAAEDGTIRRFVQGVLDPLQQLVADRCHLTRKTGEIIAKAGFSTVEIQQVFVSTATIVNPHVYGIAYK